MSKGHKVLPFSVAVEEGLRRLVEHEEKILGMLPNLRGQVMTIRSDTWQIKIHDSTQKAYDDARAALEEPHEYPIDVLFRVIGESSDPSLHDSVLGELPDSIMHKKGSVSIIDKKLLR